MSIFGNKIFGNKATDSIRETLPADHPAGAGVKSDAQWRQELTPEEYHVLREAGTERPYTGEYWDTHTSGVYQCRACGTELFTSNEKFDSHCGWPSFWAPLAEGTVRYIHDRTLGMERIEVRCATCDSHLGHVFEGEGYGTPTDQRFCINSVSLKLVPRDEHDGAEQDGGEQPGGDGQSGTAS
ncbi:peptide-methionine (R)-S-oxide reductase MsrB [Pseudarthrobacter sp. CCNWLW207]|uniref:peptide-methionine (R)-S-oxide reductase MsrB n=1 Tax=Pseudarthrobacter sp. CCNWLW207 TaxID=3127468 RepID=UPI003077E15F